MLLCNVKIALRKNKSLVIMYIIFISLIYILLKKNIFIINNELICDNNFQYNIISFNSVIAGFLFTGLSIIMTLSEKPGIDRLYKGGYLDVFYNTVLLGILHHVISILSGILLLFNIKQFLNINVRTLEIIFFLLGMLFFVKSTFYLRFLLSLMKKYRND